MDTVWRWGMGALRYILNGDNEPSRVLIHELGLSSYCTGFTTYFTDRGAREDNANYNNSVQDRYKYTFPFPDWQQEDLDDLLCNVYCQDTEGDTCDECWTTLDDYMIRYMLGVKLDDGSEDAEYGWPTNIHPFTGRNCSETNSCPMQVCHESFTVHEHYSRELGWIDPISGKKVPNFEAAEHLSTFNVGYFDDVYSGNEPCAYGGWNGIEYTTNRPFCYLPGGMSGVCRAMQSETLLKLGASSGSLTQVLVVFLFYYFDS